MNNALSILVVEDNPGDFTLLNELLYSIPELTNAAVMHAWDIEKAIQFKEEYSPDVILLDLNLPGSFGLETFLTINKVYPFAAIIILSGLSDKEIALHCIQAGAQDFILKGEADERLFLKTVQYSIERKRQQNEIIDSNQRFQLVSKATNDAVWDWNIKTGEIIWNEKVEIFGFHKNITNNIFWKNANLHPDDKANVQSTLKECLEGKQEKWSAQYRFRCFNDEYKYINDRGYIVRSNNGEAVRIIGVMEDITEQVVLQQKINSELALKQAALLNAIIEGQEIEKLHIGKELHDNVSQILAGVKIFLSVAAKKPEKTESLLDLATNKIDEILDEIRKLSHILVIPVANEGNLIDKVRYLTEELNKSQVIDIRVSNKTEDFNLSKEKELAFYRIVQEQLNNIFKHAAAKDAVIIIEQVDNKIRVSVKDNGVGFDANLPSNGIGFKNIFNRLSVYNGTMNIITAPGKGCSLEAEIPL